MLILVAHGSRDPNWRTSVESVVESLQAELGPGRVRLAYMDYTPPTLEDIVSEAAEAGVDRVRVLPLFVTDEGHVNRDIRPDVERLQGIYQSVEVALLSAVGQHALFREMLARIASETAE